MVDATRYDVWRRRVVEGLQGTVLEIGAGDGDNASFLAPGLTWIALEPDRRRAARLRALARTRRGTTRVVEGRAEDLPLSDHAVDAVLATFSLCSVRDLDLTLAEARRVLRTGGRLAFLEHVGAPRGTVARRLQGFAAPVSRLLDHGCDPARDTEDHLRAAGFADVDVERFVMSGPLGLRIDHIVGVATVRA